MEREPVHGLGLEIEEERKRVEDRTTWNMQEGEGFRWEWNKKRWIIETMGVWDLEERMVWFSRSGQEVEEFEDDSELYESVEILGRDFYMETYIPQSWSE